MARPKKLKKQKYAGHFPNISKGNHTVTSDRDAAYNCIAYAAGITNRKYWPSFNPDYFWPPNVTMAERLDAFVELYRTFGYTEVNDGTGGTFVDGIEKIAIYVDRRGTPTHAARQIGPGLWTSKLGDDYDIEHQASAISGGDYGEISVYMQRPRVAPQV